MNQVSNAMLKLLKTFRPRHCTAAAATQLLNGPKKTPHLMGWGVFGCRSLTMSYFHTGVRTIIGAKAFHGPVRDGKEWYHLAMVIRHNGLPGSFWGWTANS